MYIIHSVTKMRNSEEILKESNAFKNKDYAHLHSEILEVKRN